MATITLQGDLQATVGERFVFKGANDAPDAACAPCGLKRACFNLDAGETYEVVAARDKLHPCFLHEGGRVRVVEVERAEHDAIVPSRGLIEGESMVYPRRACDFRGCPYWRECVGAPLRVDATYRVVRVGEVIPCPLGYALRRAHLAPK